MPQPIVQLGSRAIGAGQPTFVVAEMACAHEGSADRALRLIEAIADSGIDAIQLQIFRASALIATIHPNHDLVTRLELTPEDWRRILARTRTAAPRLWVNVFDPPSLALAIEGGAEVLKIHSTDVAHPEFLSEVASSGLPISLSAGGSTADELACAVDVLRNRDVPFFLMHGYQAYPTPIDDTHLARIATLKRLYDCPVGFQDHAAGDSPMAWLLPAAAVGAGADVIEKHVTDDRSLAGIDHEAALEPRELTRFVEDIRALDAGFGSDRVPSMSRGERHYRSTFKRSIVAARPIVAGETIEREDIAYLRAGSGLAPREAGLVLGRVAARDIPRHQALDCGDLCDGEPAAVTGPGRDREPDPCVVACIAVRMKSRRLPQKALLPIDGVPMLRRLIARLQTAETVDRVVVCTSDHPDDRILVDQAEAWGAVAFAGSESDVLSRFIGAGEQCGADLIVRVTGDNVLTDPAAIDRLVALQRREGADYTRVSGVPLGATPEVMTLPFLRRLYTDMNDPRASEYLIFFAFDPERYRCRILQASPETHRPRYALTVDTPADLELMERLHRALPSGPGGPSIAEVCRFLDVDPDYHGVRDDAPIKLPDGVVWRFADYLRWHEDRSAAAR